MNNFYHYGLKSFIHGYVEGCVARTAFHCVTRLQFDVCKKAQRIPNKRYLF